MLPATNEIRIETCTLCNYKCLFCPHSTSFRRRKQVMTNDFFNSIIKMTMSELPTITEVTVSGFGEALLDKELLQKVSFAKTMGYNIHVLTNGSLLNEDLIDKLLDYVSDIRISLHTTMEENYNSITQTKNYLPHVLRMIDYIASHPKKNNSRLIVTSDVIEENKNDIEKFVNDLENHVDLIEVWKPHNWVTWGNYRQGPIVKNTCGRPWNTPIQVQVDETINMCCFDYNGELLLGDLKTQTFKEIFSGNEITYIRDCHKSIESIKDCDLICSQCDQIRDVGSIVLYNNVYSENERVGKTSTNYRSLR